MFSGPTRYFEAFDVRGELGVLAYGAAGELADAEAGAEGLFEADFDLVVVEDALAAGEVEGFEDLGDGDGAVFGDDADGVAGGVGHALFDGELYVAGLLLRAFAGEEAVVGHGGEEGVVAGVFGCVSRGLRLLFLHLPLRSSFYGKTHWPEMQGHLDELRVNHVERWVHLVVFLWWLVVLLWCVVVLRFRDDCCVSNSGRTPLPPWGYFAAMFFVLIGLRSGRVCKIFITNELPAKYWNEKG